MGDDRAVLHGLSDADGGFARDGQRLPLSAEHWLRLVLSATDFGPWETVRTWHDRFKADGLWADIAALLTRPVRQDQGRNPEPSTVLLDSQSVKSGPQAGERGVDGKKRVKGIKRHVLTCFLRFVLAVVVTAANVHDTAAAGP